MLFRYLNLYKTAGFLPVFFLPIQASDNVLHVGENDTCLKISLSPGRQWGMIFSVQKITCKHVYHISKYFPKKVLNIEYLQGSFSWRLFCQRYHSFWTNCCFHLRNKHGKVTINGNSWGNLQGEKKDSYDQFPEMLQSNTDNYFYILHLLTCIKLLADEVKMTKFVLPG